MSKKKENTDDTLDIVINQINKQYGVGSLMFMDDDPIKDLDVISTGSLNLNATLGVGGLPKGRIIELYGKESSAKTTVSLHVIANAQKNGDLAAFIDVEHALRRSYAEIIGVNSEKLLISQPSTGEEALDIVEQLVTSDSFGVIVVDSVAALMPESVKERKIGEFGVGELARLMSQSMNKLVAKVSEANVCLIFINQIRANIATFGFGSPETTPGGNALKFYSSIRIRLSKSTVIKEGEKAIGTMIRAKIEKNKVAPPYKVCEFPLIFDYGISMIDEVIDVGVANDIIIRKGPYYVIQEEKLQGKKALREYLSLNEKIVQYILTEKDKIQL